MIFGRAIRLALIGAMLAGSLPVRAQDSAPAPSNVLYVPQDKDERGLWMQMDEEERKLRTSSFVVRDPALNAYVRKVFCRTVGPACDPLRLYIVRTPYFNATSSPNGMIQIWSGLLLRTRDEAQLAAVLGHEYVHYRDRHVLALWRNLKSATGSASFMMMFGLVGGLLALAQLSSIFTFSREQEAAADAGSIDLLVKAGYDPMAATRIWEQIREEADATAAARKVKSRKDKNGGMFATHPPTAERVTALKALAEKAAVGPGAQTNQAEYRAALASLWPSLIDDQVKLNDFGATEFLLASLADHGWTPSLNYARGELYRARGKPEDYAAAAGFYRQATTDATAPPEVWRGLGLSLLHTGAQADGQAALKTYLGQRPDASDKAMIAMLAGV